MAGVSSPSTSTGECTSRLTTRHQTSPSHRSSPFIFTELFEADADFAGAFFGITVGRLAQLSRFWINSQSRCFHACHTGSQGPAQPAAPDVDGTPCHEGPLARRLHANVDAAPPIVASECCSSARHGCAASERKSICRALLPGKSAAAANTSDLV